MSLLLRFEILGIIINTLTVNERGNKFFLNFLLHFWKVDQILKILKKKHNRNSLCVFEIIECEKRGNLTI